MSEQPLNRISANITQPRSQGASQAMLYATGLTEQDMHKAQVGIASVWYEGNPCNMHLNDLAATVREGVANTGLVPMRFNTIGVSDGMSMGTRGMCFSLQSRDLIADSVETVMGGQWYDGLITIPGCDKNMPGVMMAMGRVNRPALMVYGGTIRPGHSGGKTLDIVSAFQSYGEYIASTITDDERQDIVRHALPRRRRLRRHVHRQHHGIGHRSHGHVAALQLLDPRHRPRQDRRVPAGRAGRPRPAGEGPQAPRHHDP